MEAQKTPRKIVTCVIVTVRQSNKLILSSLAVVAYTPLW